MSDYVPEEKKRAGNSDRDHYIDRLTAAISTGHLSEEEFAERRDKALQAVIKGDLMPLVADLPQLPPKPQVVRRVTYQIASSGSGTKFSPWRWGSALVISVSTIVLPGPLFAAMFHGFDHAPLSGGLPVLMIIAGIASLLGFGTAFAPGDCKDEYV